jgi:glucokinase
MPAPADPLLLGLDIGGTKLGLCVGTPDGRVLAREQLPMDPARPPHEVLADAKVQLERLARSIATSAQPGQSVIVAAALGAACPGPFSYQHGRFLDPPNMPAWHNFPLRDWLKANFACPVALMNDANASALAEWQWGAARGSNTAVYLTMSTGMGAGLIINGRLFEGPLGLAGEIGRIRLRDDGPVGFAKRGSVEGFLSGPGMAQLALQEALIALQSGEPTALTRILHQHARIDAEALCAASASGDAAARRVTDRIAHELGRLLAILNDVLNPDVIVLGTIGSAHPDLFIPAARRVLLEEGVRQSAERVRILPSTLTHRGDQSALAVAARPLSASTV